MQGLLLDIGYGWECPRKSRTYMGYIQHGQGSPEAPEGARKYTAGAVYCPDGAEMRVSEIRGGVRTAIQRVAAHPGALGAG